jgi:hypothetical protein
MVGFTSEERMHRVKLTKQSPSGGLLDDVRKAVSEANKGPATWYEQLTPEHRKELDAIRSEWASGKLGTRKKTVARAIADNMRTRGISNVGMQGVRAWLEKA